MSQSNNPQQPLNFDWLLQSHPAPWRYEYECPKSPCKDCAELQCAYTAEPVIYDANNTVVIELDRTEINGPCARMSFADFIVLSVNQYAESLSGASHG